MLSDWEWIALIWIGILFMFDQTFDNSKKKILTVGADMLIRLYDE